MGTNLPTILPYTFLFHLLNPSSISYSRRYYPSHLSYPTFPSSYHGDEVYPEASSPWCTAPTSSSPWCTTPASSSSWRTTSASSSQWCTVPACRAGGRERGPLRGGEEKKDCARFGVFHGWNIPPLAAVSSQATWQPAQSRIYCTFS